MKEKLIEKLQERLKYQNHNRDTDSNLLSLYINDAIEAIIDWRNLSDDSPELLSGRWDTVITEFVVESLQYSGSEGKDREVVSGLTNQYFGDPLSNLHTRVPQRIR